MFDLFRCPNVRCWMNNGKHLLVVSFSGFDPLLTSIMVATKLYVGVATDGLNQLLSGWRLEVPNPTGLAVVIIRIEPNKLRVRVTRIPTPQMF